MEVVVGLFPVVPSRTALVNVDLQNFFVESAAEGPAILGRVNELAAACRAAGVLVVHTAHVLRPDGSNVGVLGELIPAVRDEGFLYEGSRDAALHADLVVDPLDVYVAKPRFGGFHDTELEHILRDRGIDTIAITGISTDVCCDTTAREANARDFRVLFVGDATAVNAVEADVAIAQRQAVLELLDGLFAEVVTSDEFLDRLQGATTAQP
ncbi:MAG TPA: isochorismatase family cysteine hydrolase [Candidatus Limnocylindrales bacterium]|nr:isochorismatase family cysteine hydrolase [Candidatus Limnocylindrales bacterium]